MEETKSKPSMSALGLIGVVIVVAGTGLIAERYLSGSFAPRTNQTEMKLNAIPTPLENQDMPIWATKVTKE